MSRVLKSSQIILDKNKYKLPIDTPFKKPSDEKVEKELMEKEKEKEEEILKAKQKEEMDKLYEETINNANDEADKIISEAYEKSKKIMESAYEEGFNEGKLKGFEEGRASADSIIQEALELKRQSEAKMKSLIEGLEEEVVNLTISAIEKILNRKVEENDIVFNLIHAGLEKCAFTEDLVLRVSPEDYDFASSSKDKILVLSQNINDIIIKQDKALKKGSCIIDTPSGSVDSSVWVQFNEVKEMFEELLRNE
ncbi:FliH/SctL family protein [Maledivibacter halophilus]|uniref:Flagellar assembly protein FliH n=1 Tax=Maledivibacter halophilus TaxID=36842 RepID=A0A1T5LEI0_9FIRM|nr:FliH/SctL family protein [Maledivibacter halophilus]SKC74446.1 flagellar assembly protein FliH [Maledivibacter halophilus]